MKLRSRTIWIPLVFVVFLGANARLFVWPTRDAIDHASAVAVLAGGRGERLHRALELMREGVASTLLVSEDRRDRICKERQQFHVVCFMPSPPTTRGEAEAIARLARSHRWTRLVVVTSTYHVTRARLLMGRCDRGSVSVIGATPRDDVFGWIGDLAHEWGGLAEALIDRGC
jgi:uncharacterized SAM-binding protein YcdF (DUF218 family)